MSACPTARLRRWVEDRMDWTLLPDAIRREWVHDNVQTLMGVVDWVETRIEWPLLPNAIWREWVSFKQEVEDDMTSDEEEREAEGYYTPDASEKVEE